MPSKTEIVPPEGKTLKSYPQHVTLNYRRPPEILSGRERISSANLSAINLATDVFPRRLSRAGSAPETFTFFNRETNRNAPSPLFCSFKPFHEKNRFLLKKSRSERLCASQAFFAPFTDSNPMPFGQKPVKTRKPARISRILRCQFLLSFDKLL